MRLWLYVTIALVGAFIYTLTYSLWITVIGCVAFFFAYVPIYIAAWTHIHGRQ